MAQGVSATNLVNEFEDNPGVATCAGGMTFGILCQAQCFGLKMSVQKLLAISPLQRKSCFWRFHAQSLRCWQSSPTFFFTYHNWSSWSLNILYHPVSSYSICIQISTKNWKRHVSPSGNVDPDPSWGHPTKVSKEDDSSTSFVLYLIVDCIYCRCTLYSEEVCFPAQTMQTTWGNITSIHLALSHCHDLWIPIDSESIAWEDIRRPWIDTSVLPQAHRSSSCNLAGSEEGVCCGMTASISCVFLDFKGHSDPWNYRQKTRSQTQNKLHSFPVSDTTTLNDCRRASDENSLHEIASRNENVVPRHLTNWNTRIGCNFCILLYDSKFKGIKISTAETGVCITDMEFPSIQTVNIHLPHSSPSFVI